ncbi:hypothetical protein C8Q80DRAFT_564839 [Daedaleopsis nitida]|nr:hypothetical protein C8Q80DRAFT_564839 [Daedaleopsis nitida]
MMSLLLLSWFGASPQLRVAGPVCYCNIKHICEAPDWCKQVLPLYCNAFCSLTASDEIDQFSEGPPRRTPGELPHQCGHATARSVIDTSRRCHRHSRQRRGSCVVIDSDAL